MLSWSWFRIVSFRSLLLSYLFSALLLLPTACQKAEHTLAPSLPIFNNVTPGPPDLPTEQYIIHVGDELDIVFYSEPRLNQLMYVRPDGYISLQLIGEVRADGLSVPELRKTLEEKYSEVLSDPRLNVNIKTFASYIVFIGGEVKEPSAIKYDGRITVLQAVSLAGGFYPKTAILDDVLVIRRQPGKPPKAFSVDLNKIIDGTDLSQDFYLYQFDTVYVKAIK